jgi:large subunit ribosomal protein L23
MTTIYDVLRRPLVTEKSNYQTGKLRQYSFEVTPDANRTLVKEAVEQMFDVKVLRVNIINTAGKRSRRRNRRLMIRAAGFKKAIVTLAEGSSLEFLEGVK